MMPRLTVEQFRTLEIIARYPGGMTLLLPMYWRDRHHQSMIRRGFLRLRADPFKTKANMLRGRITANGRKAVQSASAAVRAQAKANADRDYEKYMREREAGYHE
jgi:hypothetical protein